MSDVLVLCYHAVAEDWPAPMSVTPSMLERQLRSLLEYGYRGTTFVDAVTRRAGRKLLAVTFDDGYRSVVEQAFPILSALGLPATVFVATNHIATGTAMSWPGTDRWLGGPYERELVGASWQELGQLAERGWEIGSHTRSHARLTGLDDSTLEEELVVSREECERRLRRPCRSIAYPYGDVDSRVARRAANAGYEAGAALPGRLHPADRMRWPRIGIYSADQQWRFRLKVARPVRWLRASPAWRT